MLSQPEHVQYRMSMYSADSFTVHAEIGFAFVWFSYLHGALLPFYSKIPKPKKMLCFPLLSCSNARISLSRSKWSDAGFSYLMLNC